MKILHTYCLNHNVGDYALGIGVRNIFRHYANVELFATTNLQGTVFNKYYINEVINRKYDLLVIGGGGIIHGAHWPHGWFWLIEKQLIQTIKIPFVIYAAGYNYFEGETGIPERGILHLHETIKHASFFSVRNDGSSERLKQQAGIIAPEIPDPGFHIELDTTYSRIEPDPYILIQLAYDKPEHRFSDKLQDFISEMRLITKRLSTQYKVIFVPHVYEDIALSKTVAEGISNCSVLNFGTYAFDHPYLPISYYKFAECVLAMRGHGQIIPFAFNVPTIALCNHPKHSGLMDRLGIGEFSINIKEVGFSAKALQKIEYLINNKEVIIGHYNAVNIEIGKNTSDAMKTIVSKITK